MSPVGVMAVENQENQAYTHESAAMSHGFEVSLTEILPKLKDNETEILLFCHIMSSFQQEPKKISNLRSIYALYYVYDKSFLDVQPVLKFLNKSLLSFCN